MCFRFISVLADHTTRTEGEQKIVYLATVFPAKTANFRFEKLQLKHVFHEIPMSYIY